MAEYQRCPQCNHAEIRAVGMDCPICFQQQRAKMRSADNSYLRQMAYEGIQSRRAQSHVYKQGTAAVASATNYQHTESLLAAENGVPLLRKSELTDRITAHQNFSSHCIRPLRKAGAISLHPLGGVAAASHSNAKQDDEDDDDDDDVFFDEAPYRHSNYVLVNGEVFKGAQPLKEDRTLYAVDSPVAAVHAAVGAAIRRSNSTKAPHSSDSDGDDNDDDNRRSEKLSQTGSRQPIASKGRRDHDDKVREFLSSSGRRYRVVELCSVLPPIENGRSSSKSRNTSTKEKSRGTLDTDAGAKGRSHRSSRNAASSSGAEQRLRSEDRDNGSAATNSKGKHVIVPQKPPKKQERTNRSAKQESRRDDARRSASPHDEELSRRQREKVQSRNTQERHLPPIDRRQRHRSASPPPKRKQAQKAESREKAECRRRHVDSMSSESTVSSYSMSSLEKEFNPTSTSGRGQSASDCVIMDDSDRPMNRPRKRRGEKTREGPLHTSLSSSDSLPAAKRRGNSRRDKNYQRNRSREEKPDFSDSSDEASWSDTLSGSLSTSLSESDASSDNEAGQMHRRRNEHRHRGRDARPLSISGSLSEEGDMEQQGAKKRKDRQAGRHSTHRSGQSKRVKSTSGRATRSPYSSASLPRSGSTKSPMQRHGSGVDQPHHSRPASPPRPPVVYAVVPPSPNSALPALAEEMLPSTRYDPVCPSPVAHVPHPSSAPLNSPPQLSEAADGRRETVAADATGECVSPAVAELRTAEKDTAAANPMRRAYEEIPAEPLQMTHFADLRPPSVASSGPVHTPSHGTLEPFPFAANGMGANARALLSSNGAVDLDYITEHVLRVICERLSGAHGDIYGVAPRLRQMQAQSAPGGTSARSKLEVEEDERAAELRRKEEAKARQAEFLRLRQLLHDIRDELRHHEKEPVPLDSLTSSLKLALGQVRQFSLRDSMPTASLDNTDALRKARGNSYDEAHAGTLIFADDQQKMAVAAAAAAAAAAGATASDGDAIKEMARLQVDTATLERLLHSLRERREKHEAQLRAAKVKEEAEAERERQRVAEEKKAKEAEDARQRKVAEEEAAAAAAAAQALEERLKREREQQQLRERITALLTQEAGARTVIRAEEKSAFDKLTITAAKSEEDSRRRSLAAQAEDFENEQMDFFGEELDARAELAAMEAEEAEDFWDIAAQLWQAATDEATEAAEAEEEAAAAAARERSEAAEEASRQKSAAWQAAQAEEADRLQAEIQKMEAAAALRRSPSQNAADGNTKGYRNAIKGKLVRSNLIPGQMLDVTEGDGKVRLVGDPHVAAVEARLRERRRADRLRQEKMAAALQQRPPTTSASRSAGGSDRGLLNRQPSTVKINIVGNGVTPAAKKSSQAASRVPSRRSAASSRARSSGGGGSGRLGNGGGGGGGGADRGEAPFQRSRLHSQTNFVVEGDVDLGVDGQRVGTPSKTRSRASSLASAGVPHMGGIFNAATPHKNRFPEDESDALTSSSAINVEY